MQQSETEVEGTNEGDDGDSVLLQNETKSNKTNRKSRGAGAAGSATRRRSKMKAPGRVAGKKSSHFEIKADAVEDKSLVEIEDDASGGKEDDEIESKVINSEVECHPDANTVARSARRRGTRQRNRSEVPAGPENGSRLAKISREVDLEDDNRTEERSETASEPSPQDRSSLSSDEVERKRGRRRKLKVGQKRNFFYG